MDAPAIQVCLTHLTVEQNVAASTQRQALSALLFLNREMLRQKRPWMDDITRAKEPKRLPAVLTKPEVQSVMAHFQGDPWLMASLLRLMESLKLRVKDIDFGCQ